MFRLKQANSLPQALALAGGLMVSFLTGCALSPQERSQIVSQSAELAAERAGMLAMVKGREAGLSEEDARLLSAMAREEARHAASEIAERITPRAEESKRSKVGAFLGALAVALLQVLAGAGRRMR